MRSRYDGIPDVRDGLTREERVAGVLPAVAKKYTIPGRNPGPPGVRYF